MIGAVSHPNGGSVLWLFLSLRWSSFSVAGQAVMVVEMGWENCSVVVSEPSERVNPAAEKSAQVSVVRLTFRSCGEKKKRHTNMSSSRK